MLSKENTDYDRYHHHRLLQHCQLPSVLQFAQGSTVKFALDLLHGQQRSSQSIERQRRHLVVAFPSWAKCDRE